MNRSIIKNILTLLLLVLCSTASFVNAQKLKTETLNTSNGLSNNIVLSIFQDSYGLLWIGTEYGLNLYNGYEFKVFTNNPENIESINSNVICCVVEDAENNLWIATGAGVSEYLRDENKFKNYDLGIGRNYYSSVQTYIDFNGNIWAAVEGENILKYNKLNDTWDRQKFVLIDSNKIYTNPANTFKIIEDKNNKLWIASLRYGLMWFDEKENVFRQSDLMNKDEVNDFTTLENFMIDLYEDSSGVFWITTKNGIYKYDQRTNTIKTIKEYTTNKFSTLNEYNSITTDPLGNVWITNNFHGLLKFTGITDNYKTMEIADQNYFSDGKRDMVFTESLWDESGILWLGTLSKGLIKYDPNKKEFIHYVHDKNNKNSLSNSKIYSLLESKVHPGKVYVGTQGGLNLFDLQTKTFTKIPFDVYNRNGSSIRAILEEDDGSLWLATWGDGLLKMNPQRKIVKRFIPDSTNLNSISDERIKSLCKDPSGNLWIGTAVGGLNYLNVQTDSFKTFNGDITTYPQEVIDIIKNKISKNLAKAKITNVGDSQNLSVEFEIQKPENYLIVTAGEADEGGYLMWDYGWIEDSNNNVIWSSDKVDSTFYSGGNIKNRVNIGILKLSPGKYSLKYKSDGGHSLVKWQLTPPDEQELWGIRIFGIDDKSELDRIEKYITRKVNKKLIIKGSYIRTVYISKNNIVWVSTHQYGLYKINKTDNSIKAYLFDNGNKKPKTDIHVKDIYENNIGILWLATNRGLIEFNPVKESFTKFTHQDGLPANTILAILSGDNNELWLSTINGISKMIKYGGGRPTFINYDLGGVSFNSLAALKTSDRKYLFGSDKGLYEFDSKNPVSTPPKLLFSDLKISNVSISKMDEDLLGGKSIMNLKNLTLNHTQNNLSFEFAVLHFSNPKKNKYAHKLEGYEDDWIYDNKRIVTYTNLDPGEYTFKFKGSNNDGVWNENSKSISIIILPPWWLTWWAYSIYFVVTFIAIYGLRKYELNRIQLKNRLKLEHVSAEKLRELDQLKSRFFANISHEFRTPLTLILGQTNSLLSNNIDTKIKSKLEVANRNARRLLHLINQLLDLSKIESGSMNVKSVRADIVSFTKNIFYSFESLAEEKNISFNFSCEYSRIEIDYEPEKLEKVFLNLLSNAFKFTDEGGKIEIAINCTPSSVSKNKVNTNGIVEITISDTGIGIPAENILHLFNRFYQVDNSTTREYQGTGIGLALSKELVELHGGKITVTSEPGVGSAFIIQLPFKDGDLFHDKHQNFETELSQTANDNEGMINDSLFPNEKDISSTKTSDIKKTGKEIILVVEDNSDVRNYIAEQLINEFQVLEAEDGQEGILLAKERIPDLIITDVMMPKVNGYQLTADLKQDEKTSHIPIIMLTAKAEFDNKIEGLETGVDDYIIKPFNPKELLIRVKNLIATREQLRKQFSKATIIKPSDVTAVSMDQQFLKKVINTVEKHIEDEKFSVDKLAEEANMSVSQLNRKLGALIDQPAGKLIRSMRLQRAADLLKKNIGTIAEICYKVGFNEQTSFARAFKKQFGESPSNYKIRFKENNDKPGLS